MAILLVSGCAPPGACRRTEFPQENLRFNLDHCNDTQVTIGADSFLLVGVNGVGANAINQADFLLS